MTDKTQFKHIKVNTAQDEDVVIFAGAHDEDEIDSNAEPSASPHPTSSPAKSADEYYETTLEDIKSSKMPRMQIAIIAVAVFAIVAFALWYAFIY